MALKSKPLMICNFFFGYLLIRYYRSIMLNIYEIRDVTMRILEILFTFLYSNSYMYVVFRSTYQTLKKTVFWSNICNIWL